MADEETRAQAFRQQQARQAAARRAAATRPGSAAALAAFKAAWAPVLAWLTERKQDEPCDD